MSELDKKILAQTVYLEACGEIQEGWRGVAFVIINRAKQNRSYWCGRNVADVCKCPGQFECWNRGKDYQISDTTTYNKIKTVTDKIYNGSDSSDPTLEADHYNNPDKEGYPEWTKNCRKTVKIGNHQFYKSK